MKDLLFFRYETGFVSFREAEARAAATRESLNLENPGHFMVRRTSRYLKDGRGRMHFVRVYERIKRSHGW